MFLTLVISLHSARHLENKFDNCLKEGLHVAYKYHYRFCSHAPSSGLWANSSLNFHAGSWREKKPKADSTKTTFVFSHEAKSLLSAGGKHR